MRYNVTVINSNLTKYDIEIMNENYLLKIANDLYNEYNEKIAQCRFFNIDKDCEIRYMKNLKGSWSILLCGQMSEKLKRDKKIFEKEKLKSNTKNYYKLSYKNNLLMKAESYINGKIDNIYLCYYFDNLRILKPFSENGGFYPTYTLITVYSNNKVVKEVYINDSQIIIEIYSYNRDSIDYECANLVPTSPKNKIISYSKGTFTDNSNYTETESFSWLETL